MKTPMITGNGPIYREDIVIQVFKIYNALVEIQSNRENGKPVSKQVLAMEDHMGVLNVVWSGKPTEAERKTMSTAWKAAILSGPTAHSWPTKPVRLS